MQALYSQSSDGDDELEEASAMDAAYGSDEVDALEDDTDAMEETSSVVSGDTSGLVAGSSDPSMQAEQQVIFHSLQIGRLDWHVDSVVTCVNRVQWLQTCFSCMDVEEEQL